MGIGIAISICILGIPSGEQEGDKGVEEGVTKTHAACYTAVMLQCTLDRHPLDENTLSLFVLTFFSSNLTTTYETPLTST